jgi:threonine aldolase
VIDRKYLSNLQVTIILVFAPMEKANRGHASAYGNDPWTAEAADAFRTLFERDCRSHGLRLHMDGARFANACSCLGCSPAEMSWKCGVDVLCFGGTKNGMAVGEASIF